MFKQIFNLLFVVVGLTVGILNAQAVEKPTRPPATKMQIAKVSQPGVTRAAVQQRVNINTAGVEALSSGLKGIGPKKAQAIIDFRKQYGAFKSLAELTQVKGIGPATLEKNSGRIVLR